MRKKNSFLKSLFLLLPLSIFISCEESLTTVGDVLLPNENGLNIRVDTLTNLKFKTVAAYPMVTENLIIPYLGHYIDETVGETKCTYLTQFHFYENYYSDYRNLRFPDNPEITGGKLKMYISYFYGYADSLSFLKTEMKFSVYGLSSGLSNGFNADTTFNSSMKYTDYFERKEVGAIQLTFDQLGYDTIANGYFIEIPVSLDYLNEIKDVQNALVLEYQKDTTIEGADLTLYNKYFIDSAFNQKIAGIAIESELINAGQSNGGIFELSTNQNYTQLIIDFNYNDTVGKFIYDMNLLDQFYYGSYYRPIRNYSMIERIYEGYFLNNFINQSNDSLCFVQSLSGFNVEIEIPGFDSLIQANKGIAINKALFNIEEAPGFDINDIVTTRYLWTSPYSNNVNNPSSYYLLANKNISTFNEGKYSVNLPHILQGMLDGELDNSFYLLPAANAVNASNVIQNIFSYNGQGFDYQVLNVKSAKLIVSYTVPSDF